MKQTDTFKYELLLRLCDEAAHDNEAVELAPQDILPHYGERDTQAERKQAAHFFSAVQSLESLRIVRMKKSRRDGATYVDSIVLEDLEAAAAELAKFERRLEQEARGSVSRLPLPRRTRPRRPRCLRPMGRWRRQELKNLAPLRAPRKRRPPRVRMKAHPVGRRGLAGVGGAATLVLWTHASPGKPASI